MCVFIGICINVRVCVCAAPELKIQAVEKWPNSPTAVQILSWPHWGLNHRPCGSKSSNLTTTLQAAPTVLYWSRKMIKNRSRPKIILRGCFLLGVHVCVYKRACLFDCVWGQGVCVCVCVCVRTPLC